MSKPNAILIIDDNEHNRYTFSRYLRQAGFDVWETDTGKAGLTQAKEGPDLILLDVQLPDGSGFDFCRQIKSDPRTASIPIVHTSASFTESIYRIQGLSGGADGYLVHPIDPNELVATIRALLRVRAAENAAQKLAEQWKATFEAISGGVALIDANGVIQRHNIALESVFGLREFTNVSLASILEDVGLNSRFLSDTIAERRQCTTEVFVKGRWFQFIVNPILDVDEAEIRYVCVFSDITNIRKAEEALQNINLELERRVKERTSDLNDANLQMETFCYSVSHDLRAPVRAMNSFAELLLEEHSQNLNDEGRQFVERIRKAAMRMDLLIQDLLTYSRVSRQQLPMETIPLHECVSVYVEENQANYSDPKPLITLSIPEELVVIAHPITLRQAVANLIGNAVKFVAPGVRPELHIYATELEGNVRLSFRDNGIGIPSEYQHKIFNIFERIHTEGYSGTGIGLAIVRRAMERMSGIVGFESTEGKGSTFWLELPKATARQKS